MPEILSRVASPSACQHALSQSVDHVTVDWLLIPTPVATAAAAADATAGVARYPYPPSSGVAANVLLMPCWWPSIDSNDLG